MSKHNRNYTPSFHTVSSVALNNIVANGDAKTLVEEAEKFAKSVGSQLTTSQVRAIFGSVRQIEFNYGEDAQRRLILLKPKMQYRASREGRRGGALKALADTLCEAIDIVTAVDGKTQRKRFGYFVEFFEAILAYHKVAGGK